MNTKTYNGWTNYETWLVKLWIDNDEGSQNYWIDRTREVYESALPDKTFTQTKNAALTLMKELESEHEEALPTLQGFAADLLSAAMSEVNWHEIAVSLIEDNAEVEVVHHINGNIRDNRLENIEVLPSQSEHVKKHRKGGRWRSI